MTVSEEYSQQPITVRAQPMRSLVESERLLVMIPTVFLLLSGLAAFANAQTELRLFHRIYSPSLDAPVPFSQRGVVRLAAQPTIEHADTFLDDLDDFVSVLDGRHVPDALYQVALRHEHDVDEAQWDVSSVKACHLARSTDETLILHLSPHDRKPFTLDYFVSPIPHDGACSKPSKRASTGDGGAAQSTTFQPFINSTLVLRLSRSPPAPELRVPPPLTPQGEPVKAEPEKSLIQKYWIYIVIVLFALVLSPGASEEGGEGSGGRAGGAAGR